MLGSPLVRAAVVLAVLLLLLVPLRSFTATRAPAVAAAATAPEPETTVHLEIVSTRSPFSFSISHLGKIIWQGEGDESSIARDVKLPVPKEGIDLNFCVDWHASAKPAAAKLIVSHGDGDPVEHTLWGTDRAADVLTYP